MEEDIKGREEKDKTNTKRKYTDYTRAMNNVQNKGISILKQNIFPQNS